MNPDNFNMSEQELNAQRRRRAENFKLNIDESEYEDDNFVKSEDEPSNLNSYSGQDVKKQMARESKQVLKQKKKEEKETNRCHFGDSDTYAPFSVANEEESPEEVLEKNNELRAASPYIPEEVYTRLPEFLKRCCTHATDKRERDLMLLGSMNSCSALFPNVSFFYKKSRLCQNVGTTFFYNL